MSSDSTETVLRLAFDGILVLLVVANAWAGWKTGLVRRALSFGGLYAAIFAAGSGAGGLGTVIHPNNIYANAWSFVAIGTVVVLLFELLGYLYHEQLRRVVIIIFDRVVGAIAGAVVGFFQAALLFLVVIAVGQAPGNATSVPPGHGDWLKALNASVLASKVENVEPGIQAIFGPVLPHDLTSVLTNPNPAPTPTS